MELAPSFFDGERDLHGRKGTEMKRAGATPALNYHAFSALFPPS